MVYQKASRDRNDFRETNLLRDVAFNRHSMQDGNHVSPFDNSTIQVGTDGIEVRLVQGINERDFKRTLSMATRATTGITLQSGESGIDAIEEADDSDWEEMLKGGLQTALETQTVVFAVSGVSRACTHQLVRSRRAAFHQQSQRATFYGDHPEVRMPESVWRNPKVREAFELAYNVAARAYKLACEEDISYQDARYVLPEGTTNYILCEYTVREFLAVYAYRACSMFNWEIVSVVRQMGSLLSDAHPWLKPYIKITCETTKGALDRKSDGTETTAHHCRFQGWESVDGQCDLPWARETNRSFRSDKHRIEKKDAGETFRTIKNQDER